MPGWKADKCNRATWGAYVQQKHLADAEQVLNAVRNGHGQLFHRQAVHIVSDEKELHERVHHADHRHESAERNVQELQPCVWRSTFRLRVWMAG